MAGSGLARFGKWVLALSVIVSGWATASDWTINGFIAGRSVDGNGSRTWLDGGLGKLPVGDAEGTSAFGRLQVGLDWEPSLYFKVHLHGTVRYDNDVHGGDAGGLTEGFVQANAFSGGVHEFRFRAGVMFPPTSLENVEEPWRSPYTLQLSALNSWLAHELRPTSLDVAYARQWDNGLVFFAGAGSVSGADSAGALLAWRGFAMGDRLAVYNEVVPLPSITSLEDAGIFGLQRDDGSKPIGRDLDNEIGYQWRLGLEWPSLFVRVSGFDNRGDRELHRGEYAWETAFNQVGIEWRPRDAWSLIGEWMDGETGMGDEAEPHVQTDFRTWYVLASYQTGDWRFSARYDDFDIQDLDRSRFPAFNPDLNDENGDAVTVTAFWEPFPNWRLGLEWLDLSAERLSETTEGPVNETGGRLYTLELRYSF